MTDPHNEQRQLALPATEGPVTKLDVSEQGGVKLDALGPMVVNSDGTLSRIANWAQMTEAEKERTLRVLSARNRIRIENEKRKQEADVATETSIEEQQPQVPDP